MTLASSDKVPSKFCSYTMADTLYAYSYLATSDLCGKGKLYSYRHDLRAILIEPCTSRSVRL